MTEEMRIPKLSVGVTQCTLVEWLVNDGDEVQAGTPIYQVATDKVDSEVEAPVGGRLHIIVPAGEDPLPVGVVVGEIS